jgi:alpha-glucosidase
VRDFITLRYRLMPYFYTLAWEASKYGVPLVRPLFWFQEADRNLWSVEDAFMLGRALLLAPVLDEGARSRKVQLPQGNWFDFWDDTLLEGNSEVQLAAPLERIPMLVAAGSVLPMEENDRLILHLYPPLEGGNESHLFSDAGDGYGAWRLDRFEMVVEDGSLSLTRSSQGEYPFPFREVEIIAHGVSSTRGWVDGREVACHHNRLTVETFNQVVLEV